MKGGGHSPGTDSGLPVRPAGTHARCLNRKHHLAVSGQTVSYDHSLRPHTTSCNSCLEAHADRATWLELDLRLTHQPPDDWAGLVVRARPSSQPAAIGEVVIELHGQSVGILGVAMCAVDQRGFITRIQVNPSYRLRRFGTALVLAALNHRPSYRWATTDTGTSATARILDRAAPAREHAARQSRLLLTYETSLRNHLYMFANLVRARLCTGGRRTNSCWTLCSRVPRRSVQ
ncbi:GNAT family N-acetyltransferase [Amycolatopsis sp. NPDC088138]|uniref:GNAT family N-acetyltransferase n=1 Tax=Amycolatopsis sp. NPDC088138 TaxID=3363938 RepID=UPI0038281346